MQSKSVKFNELPQELKIETAKNLSNRDLVNLAQTSKSHLALFLPVIDVRNVRKLLCNLTRGEHGEVKAMLKRDISLIFKRGKVTDCSGREFENVSGFEYALWALDKHMWAAMIECIPSHEEGKKVFAQLIAQYNKVNTEGVTYRLNGKTITEKHFDFENTIIKELQTQVDSINAPGEKNWDAIDKQWREGVGGAQKRLPMHIVYEYCSNEPFYPVPQFTSKPEPPKRFYNPLMPEFTSQPEPSNRFYNPLTCDFEYWFSADSKLSVDFAIDKFGSTASARKVCFVERIHQALDAMTALCKVRTNDFIDLKSQLEDQMTLDNHHQVFQI